MNILLHSTLITVFQNHVQSGEPKINLSRMSSDRNIAASNKSYIQLPEFLSPKLICPPLPKYRGIECVDKQNYQQYDALYNQLSSQDFEAGA